MNETAEVKRIWTIYQEDDAVRQDRTDIGFFYGTEEEVGAHTSDLIREEMSDSPDARPHWNPDTEEYEVDWDFHISYEPLGEALVDQLVEALRKVGAL